MKENTEFESFKQMVINWKTSYFSMVDGIGGNEYLVKDFWEEIEDNILPHLESADFARWAYQQVKDLERLIKEKESDSYSTESVIKGPS